MKKILITFSFLLIGTIAFSQTTPKIAHPQTMPQKDLQRKPIGFQPTNPNVSGKSDPKPAVGAIAHPQTMPQKDLRKKESPVIKKK
jgi:hypothetical protein